MCRSIPRYRAQANTDSDTYGNVCDPCPLTATSDIAVGEPCPALVDALKELYTSTKGPDWTDSSNWNSGGPCGGKWFGIGCDTSGTITKITCVLCQVV